MPQAPIWLNKKRKRDLFCFREFLIVLLEDDAVEFVLFSQKLAQG